MNVDHDDGLEVEVVVVASYPVEGRVRHMDLAAAEAYHGLGTLGHRLHTSAAEGEASSLLGDHTLLDTHSHKGIVVEGMVVGIGNHMEEDGSGHA
jgi:hypothetical protein